MFGLFNSEPAIPVSVEKKEQKGTTGINERNKQRDSKEYEILDFQDEWNVLETSPQMSDSLLKGLPDNEKLEMLENEVKKLRARAAGEWNIKGLVNFKKIVESLKIQSGMDEYQINFCAKSLQEALKTRANTTKGDMVNILTKKDLSDLVSDIKGKLDSEFGKHKWHCLVGRKMSFHLTSAAYINFYFAGTDMTVVMFRAYHGMPNRAE